jgi:hypothetical protein
MHVGPHAEVAALALHGDQFHIRHDTAGGETPAQERPHVEAADQREPLDRRAAHPSAQVTDPAHEHGRLSATDVPGHLAARERVDEPCVVVEQTLRPRGAGPVRRRDC